MITLHTIENAYDDGNNYHQFVQRGRQALLDSKALGSEHTLRSFITSDVIDDCLQFLGLDERQCARFHKLLTALLEAGEFGKLFKYAERIYMRDFKEGDVTMTRFGSWEHDSVVIEPPSLRELQDDIWASDERFPKEDWKHEVENDETHLGYWEWVEQEWVRALEHP